MEICKNKQILNCCHPNALITLKEYLEDYAKPETKEAGSRKIQEELGRIENNAVKNKTEEYLKEIEKGARDFRF